MPTGLTHKIYDGSATELPQIIANLMVGYFWDFRDKDKLTPLADIKKQVERDIQKARENLDECHQLLLELDTTTDEDLLAQQTKRNAERTIDNDRQRAEQEVIIARYVAAEAKLMAWEPPESVRELKEGMLRHLREQITYERNHLQYVGGEITEKTAAEIRASRREWRVADVKNAEDKLAKAQSEGAEKIKFRTELYEELKRIGLKVV